jgi:hypothetical protein
MFECERGATPHRAREHAEHGDFIYLDPGIVSIMGGSKSCSSYRYHDAVGNVYYVVMPYPSCTGCLGGAWRRLTR